MNNEVSSYSIQHGDTHLPQLLRTGFAVPHRSFRWGVGRRVLNEEKAYLFLQNPLKVDRVNSYK